MRSKKQSYGVREYLVDRTYFGWLRFWNWFKKHMRTIGIVGLVCLPVIAMAFGDEFYFAGQGLQMGTTNASLLFLEYAFCLLIVLSGMAGSPKDMPLPKKRFTKHDDDETYIEESRVQELILYMEDLEDWLYDNYYTDER